MHCDKTYLVSKKRSQKFCSQDCYHANRIEKAKELKLNNKKEKVFLQDKKPNKKIVKKTIDKSCLKCGETFTVRVSKSHQQYCSMKCYHSNRENKGREVIGWHERPCGYCEKMFLPDRETRKFCSRDCAYKGRASKAKVRSKKCEQCNKVFEHNKRRYEPKFCSNKCSSESRKKRFIMECEWCGNKKELVESREGKRKYCSRKCKDEAHQKPTKIRYCKNCSKPFRCDTRPTEFCSKSCANAGAYNSMFGVRHGNYNNWMKGSSTESDPRIAEMGKKISATSKQQFASGERSHYGENNPNFGYTPADRTPEQLDRYSKAAVARLVGGSLNHGKSQWKTGWFKTKKHPKACSFYYRSSYELAAMEKLEQDPTVLSWESETITLEYQFQGATRRYLPDLLISYSCGKRVLVEIKPEKMVDLPINAAKAKAAIQYCQEKDLVYEVWTEKQIF